MAHPSTSLQALYSVFVAPALRSNTASRAFLQTAPRSLHSRYFISSSSIAHASTPNDPKASSSDSGRRQQKWDEEITARVIHLVDPTTGKLSEPRKRIDVLRSLDRNTQRLVQVSAGEESGNRGRQQHFAAAGAARVVCKIVDKRLQYQQERERKRQKKKQEQVAGGSGKMMELNWAIDPNDLGHRLERLAGFLGEGRRVEVILAAKKKGRKATTEECEAVVKKVVETMEGVKGARELKPLEGRLGGFATWVLQGKAAGQGQAK